jgi:hypothetical protein
VSKSADKDAEFAQLLRDLVACRRRAEQLDRGFLSQVIGMAVMEAAIQWDGGRNSGDDPAMPLDRLLRLKLRVALAENNSNVVALYPEG